MLAYGYEVEGNPEALADVSENLKNKKSCINWFNFNTGDLYWDGNGNGYKVEINHETKQATLNNGKKVDSIMKLNKEKFLKTEIGSELKNCITVWDNAIEELRKATPGWGDPDAGLGFSYWDNICWHCQAQWENGKYIKWFSCSSSVSNTTLQGRILTSGL